MPCHSLMPHHHTKSLPHATSPCHVNILAHVDLATTTTWDMWNTALRLDLHCATPPYQVIPSCHFTMPCQHLPFIALDSCITWPFHDLLKASIIINNNGDNELPCQNPVSYEKNHSDYCSHVNIHFLHQELNLHRLTYTTIYALLEISTKSKTCLPLTNHSRVHTLPLLAPFATY